MAQVTMPQIDALRETFGEPAKDMKLNLGNIAGSDFLDDLRIKLVLGFLNTSMEDRGGVSREDGDFLLSDDGARVHPLIDPMHSAAGLSDTGCKGLLPCLEAGEGGEQRWMDVDDPS